MGFLTVVPGCLGGQKRGYENKTHSTYIFSCRGFASSKQGFMALIGLTKGSVVQNSFKQMLELAIDARHARR